MAIDSLVNQVLKNADDGIEPTGTFYKKIF